MSARTSEHLGAVPNWAPGLKDVPFKECNGCVRMTRREYGQTFMITLRFRRPFYRFCCESATYFRKRRPFRMLGEVSMWERHVSGPSRSQQANGKPSQKPRMPSLCQGTLRQARIDFSRVSLRLQYFPCSLRWNEHECLAPRCTLGMLLHMHP